MRLRERTAGSALLRAPRRRTPGVDLTAYGKALLLLVRNPSLVLAPLAAGVVTVVIGLLTPGGGGLFGGLNAGLMQFVSFLLDAFGLSVALIQADTAWRRGRAPLDAAWREAGRKAGDILLAAVGFNFVIFLAMLLGGYLGFAGTIALGIVALFFFIYALPAAAIGGIPGGAALQVALERARAGPIPTAVAVVVCIAAYLAVPYFVGTALLPVVLSLGNYVPVAAQLVAILAQAIAAAYVALVLSKAYNDIAYRGYF